MGNFWDNSEIKRAEVVKNISEINQITKTTIFMNKYKLHLKFHLDDSPFQKMSKKVIKIDIYDYNIKSCFIKKRSDSINITIEEFYRYYSLLMDLRQSFLNEQMKKKLDNLSKSQIKQFGEDESGICPICCENPVNMSLPCSHFFCEKCIKTWIGKSDTCPLCRYKLTENNQNPTGVKGGQTWSFIDEVDVEQIDKENEESLNLLTKKLFFQNKKLYK